MAFGCGLCRPGRSRDAHHHCPDPKHLGADIGVTAVLHTWGQNLQHHPHVHCIVPAGGLSPDGGRWIACRNGFFLPVRVLSRLANKTKGRRAFFADLDPPQTFALRADEILGNERQTVCSACDPISRADHAAGLRDPTPCAIKRMSIWSVPS